MTVVERGQDVYVAAVASHGGDAGRALTHVKEAFAELGASPAVPPADLAALIVMESSGSVTATQAKTLLGDMIAAGGGDPVALAAQHGFEAMDDSELVALVDAAIAAEPEAWEKYCAGENKAMGALVGHVMKASRGQADGKAVSALLVARRS